MRRTLLLALILTCSPAYAVIVQVVAAGDDITYYDPQGLLPFPRPPAGSTMTLTLTYDSEAPDILPDDPSRGFYAAIAGLTLDVGGTTIPRLDAGLIAIYDDLVGGADVWNVTNSQHTESTQLLTFGALINRNDGTAIGSDALVPPWSAPWNIARISYDVSDISDPDSPVVLAVAQANIDSLTVSIVPTDADGDGVFDHIDNCALASNPDQYDADADGYGNICDADLNDSGLVTSSDYTILRNRLNSNDPVADLNHSGSVTTSDYTILRNKLNQPPGPSGLHPDCPPSCP